MTLKETLLWPILWPIRETAYKICSHEQLGYVSPIEVFQSLASTNDSVYTGIRDYSFKSKGHNLIDYSNNPVPNILKIYLCLDPNTLPVSEYRPQNISDKSDITYYSIKPWSKITGLNEIQYYSKVNGKPDYYWPKAFLLKLLILKPGEITYLNWDHYFSLVVKSKVDLGSRLVLFGKDEKGVYLSVYDAWDFKPGDGFYKVNKPANLFERMEPITMNMIGKPIYIYDRFYISEKAIKQAIADRQPDNKRGDRLA